MNLALGIGAGILLALLLASMHEWAYHKGFLRGCDYGHYKAWEEWTAMEYQVDQERKKIWRGDE